MQDQYSGGVSAHPTMSYAQIVKGIKHFSQALRLRGNFVVARSNRSTSQSFAGVKWSVSIIAIFGLGVIWSQVMWLIVYGPSVEIEDVFSTDIQGYTPTSSQKPDLTILGSSNPFTGITPHSEASTTVADAPETNLDLQLFGIRSGDGDFPGSAIIRTPDKRQSMFVVGDEIIDGVVLDQGRVDRIIVSRSGVRESLLLVPEGTGTSLRTQKLAAGAAESVSSDNTVSGRSLSAYLKSVRLQPRIQYGTINGFYISEVGQTAVLNGTGLMPGDVVLAVNGVRLVSAERITDVLDELRGAQNARIDIERDGSPQSVTLSRTAVQQ